MTREPDPTDAAASEPSSRRFIEQARREQIVQAAIEVIAVEGFARATFARIAGQAGISTGLISYHFRSKEQLLLQVSTDIEADLDRAIVADTADAPSYAAALRGLIEGAVRYFGDHPRELLALGAIDAHAGALPAVHEAAEASHRKAITDLADLFREGQDAGEFRAFDTRTMAIVVLAALEAAPGDLVGDPGRDAAALAVEVADTFEAATQAPRSRRR